MQQKQTILCLREALEWNFFCLCASLRIVEWKPGECFLGSPCLCDWIPSPWLDNKWEDTKQKLPSLLSFLTETLWGGSESGEEESTFGLWMKGRYCGFGLPFNCRFVPWHARGTWGCLGASPYTLAHLTLSPEESQLLSLSQGSPSSPTSLAWFLCHGFLHKYYFPPVIPYLIL